MASRRCAPCGEDKDVQGGMICEKEHFICYSCATWRPSGIFNSREVISRCPLDDTGVK